MSNKTILLSTPKATIFEINTKAGKSKVKLEWAQGFGAQRTKDLQRAQEKIDSTVMRLMEPYMQLDTGFMIMSMRASTNIGSGEVIVNTPYAKRVHYSKSGVGRKTGAKRGPRFFSRMVADKKDQILRIAAAECGAKAK